MAKPEQVLIIEPQNELRFKGPFNVPVTSYMKLTNPSEKKVIFKIKTTAPKKYCVRPNSGVLEPNSNIELAICLQPFIFDPSEKNKHKFMVQSLYAPDGDINLDLIWKEITPEQLMDSKLKCLFEVPPDQNAESGENVTASAKISAPLYSNPTSSPPSSNAEVELQKAATEVQQLREEESSLRQENLRLKEEVLRLKHAPGASQQPVQTKYTPAVQQQSVSMYFMMISVAVAILGIIIGKFLL